jgi:hypothetical protein
MALEGAPYFACGTSNVGDEVGLEVSSDTGNHVGLGMNVSFDKGTVASVVVSNASVGLVVVVVVLAAASKHSPG